MSNPDRPLRVVLVTGLSGAGKASVLRAFEDLGYEAVDNPPLPMLEEMVTRTERKLAIGMDARSRGFDATRVLEAVSRLRANAGLRPELVYVTAEKAILLRRYSETRRRHPLAPQGRVIDGIDEERILTAPLRDVADLIIDTSALPVAEMRRDVERHFGAGNDSPRLAMAVTLISFAYKFGLPPDADLVFDARFLRNPHYDPILQARTGLDPEVGSYIEADPDFAAFFGSVTGLLELLLPRFVQEGKKYATVAIGCTGGRHRSVYIVEQIAAHLASGLMAEGAEIAWRVHRVHRELSREVSAAASTGPDQRRGGSIDSSGGEGAQPPPVQAQEA
ncbi:MAG TPA: RNase adapter RapZ [Acetobacteraceae bacterium]|nr:RNase adapter RapZ [Acetobacteraceae bacterium]